MRPSEKGAPESGKKKQRERQALTPEPMSPVEHTVSRRTIGDEPAARDSLGFEPYVNAVTDFLTAKETTPPLTLSVEGEWGGGKSSFMRQLKGNLEGQTFARTGNNKDRDHLTVEFNPWRHEKEDAMWAAFALHFIAEISRQLPFAPRWLARFRLLRTRYDWKEGWLDCLKVLAFGVALLSMVITLPLLLIFCGPVWLKQFIDQLPESKSWSKALINSIAGLGAFGAVTGALLALWGKVKDYLANPLSFDLRKHLKSPDYASRISFVENFHKDFQKIVDAYIGDRYAFVFIDDLDRCDVPKAADLMQAINLMISGDPRLFFIIGMDRQKVAAGLAVKFEKAVPYLAAALQSAPEASRVRHGLEFGYNFIEKFIQIPFLVPQPRIGSLDSLLGARPLQPREPQVAKGANFLSGLRKKMLRRIDAANDAVDENISEVLEERDAKLPEEQRAGRQKYRILLSENDKETMREVLNWVAPFLDANPRRIKQFINLFRLRALIANETGLFDDDVKDAPLTIQQLAKFVVITLKWPLFLRDLENDSGLLQTLVRDSDGETGLKSLTARVWSDCAALLALLRYGQDTGEHAGDYSMTAVDIKRLLQASPRVRSTDLFTPEPQQPAAEVADSVAPSNVPDFDESSKTKKAPEKMAPARQQEKAEKILNKESVREMLKGQNYYDRLLNREGRGAAHDYELQKHANGKSVLDRATGLTWQQSGSSERMTLKDTAEYIKQLNDEKYGGHSDWRLPTLAEAMSLMQSQPGENGLYIDPVFDEKQAWIRTAEKKSASAAWVVGFYYGGCDGNFGNYGYYVRAVR